MVIGAFPESLINFRGDLLKCLKERGSAIIAMAAPSSEVESRLVEEFGVRFESFPVVRTGLNPLKDLVTLFALRSAFKKHKPDSVLAYTIKPVIYGGLAAFGIANLKFVALITGLGFSFAGTGIVRAVLRQFVSGLYRVALTRCERVIFQNPDDRDAFVDRKIVRFEKTMLVGGSGVNLSRFAPQPLPVGPPTFLLIARLLRAKGIFEYVEAARQIRAEFPEARFKLVGPLDPSPDGIDFSTVLRWQKEGAIEYAGEASDVREHLAGCHVYVLPSYHEGMPRTVLEAMATGRPILTTDTSGCRETVIQGENGFIVRVGSVEDLVARLRWFLLNRSKWTLMSARSREIATAKFDVNRVNDAIANELMLNEKA